MTRSVLIAVLGLAMLSCSPALEFPDWTTPFPEETAVREYRFVPTAERSETLALERDLVIRDGLGRGLYNPSALAVADGGTIFVLDNGNFRVVVFDQSGAALREFGSEGQGPGEFQRPQGFGIAGDRVLVNDTRNNRLSAFDFDGALLSDTQLDDRFYVRTLTDLGDDLIVEVQPPMAMGGREPALADWLVGRYTHSAELVAPIVERDASIKAYFYTPEIIGRIPMAFANPVAAIRPDKVVYATSGDQYQVLAIRPTGDPLWALRTSYRPIELTDAGRDEIVTERRESSSPTFREAMASAEFVWPTHFAALENIETDGHGNLYAFPYTGRSPDSDESQAGPFALDVYAPDGAPLFTGLASINGWDAAHGDYVFRIEDDPDTGERVVARYRVVAGWQEPGAGTLLYHGTR